MPRSCTESSTKAPARRESWTPVFLGSVAGDQALLEAEINVHYIYSFLNRPRAKTALAINIEDREVGAQALDQRGYKVLTQLDISR